MLVDEDMESKQSMFHDPLALLETERPFYEALGEQYPHPHEIPPEENFFSSSISEYSTNSSTTGSNTTDSHWSGGDSLETKSSAVQTPSLEYPLLSSFSSTTSVTNDGAFDSLTSAQLVENIFSDSESMLQFNKGMEEASKFIPSIKPLVIDLDQYNLPSHSRDNTSSEVTVIKEEIVETDNNSYRGRKHYQIEDNGYEEERSSKQSAIYVEEVVSEMFGGWRRVMVGGD
ncbi:putative transcription factor GRAS [Helianthus annuus]|nr:putative transcription factor GRAS [Helianthus annuus]